MREDEQPKIILDAAYETQPDGQEERRVYIRITNSNRQALDDLDGFIAACPGEAKVILYYEQERGKRELDERISDSEQNIAGLRRMFGAEHVKIK